MKKPATLIIVFFVCSHLLADCTTSSAGSAEDQTPTQQIPSIQKATDLIGRQQWDQAIKLLKDVTQDYPGNEEGWYYLGYAYHATEDYTKAIEANKKAVQLGGKRKADAYYNLACSYAVTNDLKNAEDALNGALSSGFLNFDLLKSDPEIEVLRKMELITFPKSQNYAQIKARNGILIKYRLILPDNYDPSKAYPAMLAYPPGDQEEISADWAIEEFWGEEVRAKGWIIVVPVAPERGWINHPAHHALNDLLREVKNSHKIEGGKFHMLGFEAGARPAATFALMSKEYFHSLTTISSYAWERWDEDDLSDFKVMPVKIIVGDQDSHGLQVAYHVQRAFKKYKVKHDLKIINGEGRDLPSLRKAAVIGMMEDFVR
ncbi:MAG: tetratricopeptide repeat protein [Cyclobacteriaceae bacterium]